MQTTSTDPALDRSRDRSAAGAPTAGQGSSSGSVSNLFTTLLVAQIRNQDPLSPMDSNQLVAQFAQMSQIETMQTMAQLLANSVAMQHNGLVATLGAQVGSTVMASTDAVELADQTVKGAFTLADSAASVKVVLTSADGVERELDLGPQRAGEVSFELDPKKLDLPPGPYSIKVKADNNEQPAIEIAGELQSVRIGPDGQVLLTVAGIGDVDASAITRFLGRQKG